MIIRRKEIEKLDKKERVIIYGRRKTGKTFFVKNFIKPDYYFFATKEGNLLYNDQIIQFPEFLRMLSMIPTDKLIAVDEFHRLDKQFLDYLHYKGDEKKVILITSTLWLAEKMLKQKQWPLAGIYFPIKFSLIDEKDIIYSLSKRIKDKVELIEAAVYLREPLLYPFYKKDIRTTLLSFFLNNKEFISNLLYQIFEEEHRSTSLIYEGILEAISSGKNKSGEISSYLFSKGIIKKDDPSLIQQHLNTLRELSLIEKREFFKKKRFYYLIPSPLLDIHFYLQQKYDYVENEINAENIKRVIEYKLPFHVEEFFVKFFSKHFGLKPVKIESPEIDISLVKFKRLEVVGEVKWSKKISTENIEKFDVKKIFVGKNKVHKSNILSFTPSKIISLSKK